MVNDLNDIFPLILGIEFASILVISILLRPYLGIVFTLVSLPLVDLLPEIPYLPSAVVLIGIVTLVGFLFQKKVNSGKPFFNFSSVHIIGLLFIGWMLISNSQAAWFGVDRNWFLTFFQLWILVWLTGELLDSSKKQHVLMWFFSTASVIAAIASIQQGNIGDTIAASTRAVGLAGSPNSTARYFVVAMVFFSYLGTVTDKWYLRRLANAGAIITFIGVFFTLSRTGIILLIAAILLIYLFNTRRKYTFSQVLVFVIAGLGLWFVSDSVMNILQSIMPSILQGTDTIGLRYRLWQVAWQMWLDNPIQGVGIGMYAQLMKYYAPAIAQVYAALGAHNTYLMVLAETGIVGFLFFLLLIVMSLRNFLQSNFVNDAPSISLRNTWLIIFLVVLLGEVTANGTHDKLLWFLIGVSIYFQNQSAARLETNSIPKVAVQA